MTQEMLRVRFERIWTKTSVPDLIVPSGSNETLKQAISDYVTEQCGETAFALHIENQRGWIDAGTFNAGYLTIEGAQDGAAGDGARDGRAGEGSAVR